MITSINEFKNINEININDNLSKFDKIKLLFYNKPLTVYRGIHTSGKNFYTGDKPLPFTYYSLTPEKAKNYGNLNTYLFNKESKQIKIFKGYDLYNKFGISNIENKNVIDTLKNENYSAILYKGDELIVLDTNLIEHININENNMNQDIIITIPKATDWNEYQKELLAAENGETLNFKVNNFPKTAPGNKCYICYNGNIIGYHIISGMSEKDFQCTTTGNLWKGKFIERTGKFHKINPIPYKGFQGFRYYK
jgi:hypothetical protein